MLDVLAKHDVPATFFLIGNNINEETAENMKRALELGCEIGNHSLTHSRMSQMDEEQVKTEILATSRMIEQITGQLPKFFRPPYIDVKPEMYERLDGFTYYHDNISEQCFTFPSVAQLLTRCEYEEEGEYEYFEIDDFMDSIKVYYLAIKELTK